MRAPQVLQSVVGRLWKFWAVRSLVLGAVSTVLDLATGISLLAWGAPTRAAAMVGIAVGSTFTFSANRYIAFRESNPRPSKRSLLFIVSVALGIASTGALFTDLVGPSQAPWLMRMVTVIAVSLPFQLYWLRRKDPRLTGQVLKFGAATLVGMVLHGQLVVFFRDGHGVPYVISKMAADVLVFTFAQLALLRWVVFPQRPSPTLRSPR